MTLKGLKCLKMFDYFDLIVSSDDILHPKPHPEPIETVLKYYHLNRDECLMVGDTYMILNVRTTQELKVLQLGGRCEVQII